jgi:hypothetical protein
VKRIPVQSVKGHSPSATESLRKLFVLHEIERQAGLFSVSFSDAMQAAERDDADGCWRHLQSALFAGIIVNRLIRRHPQVKNMLKLPDTEQESPILHMYRVRNALEHIDQRADAAINAKQISSISDWYLADRHLLVSSDTVPAGGRAFSPKLGVLFYDSEPLDLFKLDMEMIGLVRDCREVQHQLMADLPGRSNFGGGRIIELDARDERQKWNRDRNRLLASLPDRVPVDGRVRMWMQVDD